MTDHTKLLVGSLSNDLFRVATLAQRGAMRGARRFLVEAKRWAKPLQKRPVKMYVRRIAAEVEGSDEEIDLAKAERYLMYGVLLQNYALHLSEQKNTRDN